MLLNFCVPPRYILFTYKTYVMQIVYGITNYISVLLFLQEITNDLQENAKFLREMQQDSTEIQQYRTVVNDVTCRWWNNNFYYLTDSRSQIIIYTSNRKTLIFYIMLTSSMYSACALHASQFDASLQLMYNFRKR